MTKKSYAKLELSYLNTAANLICGDGSTANMAEVCENGGGIQRYCTSTGNVAGPGLGQEATCTAQGLAAANKGTKGCSVGGVASGDNGQCNAGGSAGKTKGCVIGTVPSVA